MADLKGRRSDLWEAAVRLSFPRPSGLEGERRAAEQIETQLREAGMETMRQSFPVTTYCDAESLLETPLAPAGFLPSTPVGLAGTIDDGTPRRVVFIGAGDPALLETLSPGDLALLDVDFWSLARVYRDLAARKVGGLICINRPGRPLPHTSFLPPELEAPGPLPACWVSLEDAHLLLAEDALASLRIRQRIRAASSQNILGHIRGAGVSEEQVLVTAHYDTVPGSPGAEDNASGCAVALQLALNLLQDSPPRRSVAFAFLGSEELGLRGAHHLVGQLERACEIDNIRAIINIDCVGAAIGQRLVRYACSDRGITAVWEASRAANEDWDIQAGMMGSDDAPFTARGIPVISIARYGRTDVRHTPEDRLKWLSPRALQKDHEFTGRILAHLVGAPDLASLAPVPEALHAEAQYYCQHGGRKRRDV